ncbi:MAG: M20/M25/M40 family metallo-hydrolase [Bacteroidia bacterium]|nr:M20/M25/M40 family metallo-hydrolase [Bacteroidia bacterium]
MKKIVIILVCVLFSGKFALAQTNTDDIKKHISYLADDKLQGRFPGSKGEKKAYQYITKQFQKYKLQPLGTVYNFQDFPVKYNPNPHDTSEKNALKTTGRNVIGFLNNDAEFTIVIGAHYDHLGMGHGGHSLDANPENKVHNGADDNASGVAGVLELARYFTENEKKEKYNFLFICFSGEEEGLLGSKFFVNNPTLSLDKINCMINMDMIGRLNDSTKKIIVYGTGTSPKFEPMLASLTKESVIKVKTDSAGMGPSDHASFYLKGIPVLHFFTGTHGDYHRPTDDIEKINFYGEKQVLDFIVKVVGEICKEDKLTYLQTKNSQTNSPRFKVTLGIIPDYSFEGPGVRLDGVSEGKPAAAAGLKAGDILVGLGELEITDMQSYMKALSQFEKGQKTTVKFKRNGQIQTAEATF